MGRVTRREVPRVARSQVPRVLGASLVMVSKAALREVLMLVRRLEQRRQGLEEDYEREEGVALVEVVSRKTWGILWCRKA